MEYRVRAYPLFSACGLNCGLCPRYYTEGKSKCPGCAGAGFLEKHPTCGVLSCGQRKGVAHCFECDAFPCKKYDGADQSDSFITHLHQFSDMEKAKSRGMDAYQSELNEKVTHLKTLLGQFDDGRRKSFYCLAVNLLALDDVRAAMAQMIENTHSGQTEKEKAAVAVACFLDIAQTRGISLQLRKK